MPDRLAKRIGSFFYLGHLPWAPGTWGSLAGLLIFWFASEKAHVPVFLGATTVAFCACPGAVRAYASKDPSQFVADEVCGMMLGLLWLPKKTELYLAGFILFRFFDIVKPWPISVLQKKEGPSFIVWDDLLAGVFANLALRAAAVAGIPALFARLGS